GSVKDEVTGVKGVKLDREKVGEYVGEEGDGYVDEMGKDFDCRGGGVWYGVKEMGMRGKKRGGVRKKKRGGK
ncbi:IS630 transposase-related protein, partial [Neisseria sicca]|uniref:IS630 transposase-related protein n=1 Tax=Neisseria sicca TaxID=490 RepID=UPI001C991528